MGSSERKIFNFLGIALVAASALLAGCDAVENLVWDEPETRQPLYLNLSVEIPTGRSSTRGASDDSGDYDYGDAKEYTVSTVYLYFFDEDNNLAGKQTVYGFNKISSMGTPSSTSFEVWESIEPAEITAPIDTATIYTVIALVNEDFKTEPSYYEDCQDGQLATLDSPIYTIPGDGIPMSLRNTEGRIETSFEFHTSALSKYTPAELTLSPVERSYAKISLKANMSDDQTTANVYSVYWDTTSSNRVGVVTLDSWKLVNLPRNNYAFRHVGNFSEPGTLLEDSMSFGMITKTAPDGTQTDEDTEGGSPYVVTPDYDQYYSDNYNYTSDFLMDGEYKAMPTATDSYTTLAYSYENSMYKSIQTEAFCTGVFFKATVAPDTLYTLSDGALTYSVGSSSFSDSVYCFGKRFFTSIEAIKAKYPMLADLTADNADSLGIKHFGANSSNTGYVCYYKSWIKHFDNGDDAVPGASEYSIVRNNVYRLKVSKILSFGDADDDKDPDNPIEPVQVYIDVSMEIDPWILSSGTVHIGGGT